MSLKKFTSNNDGLSGIILKLFLIVTTASFLVMIANKLVLTSIQHTREWEKERLHYVYSHIPKFITNPRTILFWGQCELENTLDPHHFIEAAAANNKKIEAFNLGIRGILLEAKIDLAQKFNHYSSENHLEKIDLSVLQLSNSELTDVAERDSHPSKYDYIFSYINLLSIKNLFFTNPQEAIKQFYFKYIFNGSRPEATMAHLKTTLNLILFNTDGWRRGINYPAALTVSKVFKDQEPWDPGTLGRTNFRLPESKFDFDQQLRFLSNPVVKKRYRNRLENTEGVESLRLSENQLAKSVKLAQGLAVFSKKVVIVLYPYHPDWNNDERARAFYERIADEFQQNDFLVLNYYNDPRFSAQDFLSLDVFSPESSVKISRIIEEDLKARGYL